MIKGHELLLFPSTQEKEDFTPFWRKQYCKLFLRGDSMKVKKILALAFFLLVILAFVFIFYKHNLLDKLTLQVIDHEPIAFNETDNIFFYKDGFAISGQYINFYNSQGQQVDMPFQFDEDLGQDLIINNMTSNYMLINNNAIYKIQGMNLNLFYNTDIPVISITEYGKYLLMVVNIPDEGLGLKVLDLDYGSITDLGFDHNYYFMDLDHTSITDTFLSVLTLDVNGSFPSSKVFHYDENLSLFGVNTGLDEFFYNIFRLPSCSILIGNRRLVCYNVEGEEEWNIENKLTKNFQVVKNDTGVLIYLDQNLSETLQEEYYNGVYINNKGERQNIKLPSQLTNISSYNENKYFGLQHGKVIMIFDRNGNVEHEFFIDEDIKDIYWNQHHPDCFFIINFDDQLKLYSIEREDLL